MQTVARTSVYTRITKKNFIDWANDFNARIDADAELRLHIWGGGRHDAMEITDLSNAMKRGATCVTYSVRRNTPIEGSEIGIEALILHFGSLKVLFSVLQSMEGAEANRGVTHTLNGIEYTVYRREEKAIRVFSPLHLYRLKPLTKAPKKWTVRLATRAILNGQFDWLHCDGVYTDDYARDAALNYRQGEIENSVAWVADVIERPSGWRVWVDDEEKGIISINCHSFDTNSFKFNVSAAKERSLESA